MARRISQGLFLALFLLLIFATAGLTGAGFDAQSAADIPWPVEAFLNLDPFIALLVALATVTVPATLLFSLIVLVIALFTGRSFCGWVCPMGTLNHAVSETAPGLSAAKKIKANQPARPRHFKYFLLLFSLGAAFFGSALGGLFDPISLVTRGVALTLLPIFNFLASLLIETTAGTASHTAQQLSDSAHDLLSGIVVHANGLLVLGGIWLTLIFAAILFANRYVPRLWCRWICPLGALLGLAGRFGILALHKDESRCTQCKRCEKICSGAASPMPGKPWLRAECDLCLNCVAVCPENALSFGRVRDRAHPQREEAPHPNLKRRHVLTSAAAGMLAVPALRSGSITSSQGRPHPDCIRPPGAMAENDFLARCIRCGQCMKICPTNALHPAFDEAGLEGLWSPVLIPRIGACEPTCTLCTQVCPTGAIKRLHEDDKTGQNGKQMVVIGTAFFDQGRCLPWAMGTPCTVCEEFCPQSPKAIWLEEVERVVNGKTVKLKLPYVDPSRCSGCGACENACPVNDRAAIRVSSAGETRNPNNRLLL
ncbi:MAG: 4Fe-4S binding protein [Myxococcales bacterium]|nr:4Fe-4S binding protein [Myxococcales bacterium]